MVQWLELDSLIFCGKSHLTCQDHKACFFGCGGGGSGSGGGGLKHVSFVVVAHNMLDSLIHGAVT